MAPIPIEDGDADSPPLMHIETISQYIALPPSTLGTPHAALCASLFSPLLLSYYPPARGVVLAYHNVRLTDRPDANSTSSKSKSKSKSRKRQSQQAAEGTSGSEDDAEEEEEPLMLRVVDEYSALFTWATASFLVFRPARNIWVSGRITAQNVSHIQISLLNTFSVSILRRSLPSDWEWVSDSTSSGTNSSPGSKRKRSEDDRAKEAEGGGWFVNGDGEAVEGVVRFRIKDFDFKAKTGVSKGHIRIEGSFFTEEEEKSREVGGRSVGSGGRSVGSGGRSVGSGGRSVGSGGRSVGSGGRRAAAARIAEKAADDTVRDAGAAKGDEAGKKEKKRKEKRARKEKEVPVRADGDAMDLS